MASKGIRHPRASLGVSAAVAIIGFGWLAYGIVALSKAGIENSPPGGLGVPFGGIIAMIGAALTVNFLRANAKFRKLADPAQVIARWTVPSAEFDRFRIDNEARNAMGNEFTNDYVPPETTPAEGVEVVFIDDGVSVGGLFFGLGGSGVYHYRGGVQMIAYDPPMVEFLMGNVVASQNGPNRTYTSVLRVPVARAANDQAQQALARFQWQ